MRALFAVVVLVGLVAMGDAAAQTAAASPKPSRKSADATFKLVLEPRAMELLKAMSATLAAAKSMTFTATVGYEYPSKLGPPVEYTTRYDVAMQRPDKMRVLTLGDGPTSEFYYDGKTMSAYAPVENLSAVADAPPTVDAALAAAYKNAAIFYPFMDLVASDPYKSLTDGAVLAFYIGQSSTVGAVKTDMLAWANDDVFLQIWIGTDDKLPRRVRATFRADPLRLRHELELSHWQLDPAIPPDTFVSVKAQSAGRMAFAAPAAPPRGVKPITGGKKPAAKAAAS